MRKLLRCFLIGALWIGIWQIAGMLVGQTLLLPGPVAVAGRLVTLCTDGAFWASVGASLLRILAGYLLGMTLGFVLGIATARWQVIAGILQPLLYIVRATPVSSFIILVLLWLHTELVPVLISMLMVLSISWQNIRDGYLQTDTALLEMGHTFGLSHTAMLRHIYLPSLRPYIASAAVTALGLAWKSGVAAEVLCHPDFSIGSSLYDAKIYLETTDLFAWTFVVILLSILLEQCIRKLVPAKKEVL